MKVPGIHAVVFNAAVRLLSGMNGKRKSKELALLLEKQQEIVEKIGAKIIQLRKEKGLSQERFANSFGIDRAQLGRIERGTDMKISSLVRVLDALDISAAEFFKDFK